MKNDTKSQKTSFNNKMRAVALKSYPSLGIDLLKVNNVKSKQETLALIEQFKSHPNVAFIEPNYLWHLADDNKPNDPFFQQLWALNNTGQYGGAIDADIDALEAYCISGHYDDDVFAFYDVVVGILDTGIDYTHEDLAENMWQNLGEDTDGDGVLVYENSTWVFDEDDENGIDDDGNGYVDDFVGWDFVNDDNDPMDVHSHGTHCAGTIGAVMNNSIGINGVAINAKLAALKFLTDSGSGSTTDAIEALNYAIAMNIRITNNSWGGGYFSDALRIAIDSAKNNNHLFIAAAGNYNLNNDLYNFYPASYDNENIISVAATNRNDNSFISSNYGATTVDIAAPGVGIYSCIPGNGYDYKTGTSMATPHISAVCAMVWGPWLGSSYSTIKNALMNSVDVLTSLEGKCLSEGRVNMHNALVAMSAIPNSCYEEDPPVQPEPICDPNKELQALITLYNATNGENWTNTWNLNQPLTNWYGVTTNTDGCVTQLQLDNNNLNGQQIPSQIGDLENLEVLNLDGNNLNGSIPLEISELRKLTILSLGNNNLTGGIPSQLGNLKNLEGLDLRSNPLGGNIPVEIGNLSKLTSLVLAENELEGTIPVHFANLDNLGILILVQNSLTGSVPPDLGNLNNLSVLALSNNELTGNIPLELGRLSNLGSLAIANNGLSGCYPERFYTDMLICLTKNNAEVSDGNNFDTTWENFCTTTAGKCIAQVLPGDFDNNGKVEVKDMLYWGLAYFKEGIARLNPTNDWIAQNCEDWFGNVNGVNNKHQDANGDGVVTENDTIAFVSNLGKTKSYLPSKGVSSPINFKLIPDFEANTVTNIGNNTYQYDFYMENEGDPVSTHGISASLFLGNLSVQNAYIDITGGTPFEQQSYFSDYDEQNRTLRFAITKTDGNNSPINDSSLFKIMVQVIAVEQGETFALNIKPGSVMQADGSLLEVQGASLYNKTLT